MEASKSELNCQSSNSSTKSDEQGFRGKDQSGCSIDLLTTQSNYEPKCFRKLSEAES